MSGVMVGLELGLGLRMRLRLPLVFLYVSPAWLPTLNTESSSNEALSWHYPLLLNLLLELSLPPSFAAVSTVSGEAFLY